ncbi:amino acid adenylation domain-containing protein [Streptomyces sp. NRRL S-448]|uniref:amino acid adenylation domain-containing protein n=1 Tax=Streptomyces sp. NRRL S-448 TaxID=1463907 RepID=UPI0035696027
MPDCPRPAHAATPPVLTALAWHAETRPDTVAVVDGRAQLTYRQLHVLTAAYARLLRREGVRPGDRVALCARHGRDTVVAMLALLAEGAAFVPLDPATPAARLRDTAERAGLTRVVTQEPWGEIFLAAGMRPLPPVPPVPAGDSAMESAAPAEEEEEEGTVTEADIVTPDALAYIIYTSGSTGLPKGVGIPRRALAHFSREIAAGYELAPGDRVLQFSSIAFDGCVEEIFPPLLAGATVVVRDEGDPASARDLLDWCHRSSLTVLHLPTAYWHEVVDAMAEDHVPLPPSVRIVSVGGETMRHDRLADWRRLHGQTAVRLVNVYGPTETTVVATWDDLAGPRAVDRPEALPTIGRPLPGVLVRLVEPDGAPATDGEGELHIGGPTVGNGYVGLPELTAERFSTAPDGTRYYRTGDLVRALPDGTLLHLGRTDRQLKVRGFRVEPEEVEQALLGDAGVRDAVVRYDERRAMLVGYVRPAKSDTRLDLAALTGALRAQLPDHAVPSRLLQVDTFPTTSRGKVDTAALAALRHPTDDAAAVPAAPLTTPAQHALAEIIVDVLGVEAAGADDTLVGLGANSLTVLRVLARVERALRVRLTPADAYANPTVAALARLVERASPTAPDTTRPADEQARDQARTTRGTTPLPAMSTGPLPLTPFQRDAWLAEQFQPGTPMHTLGLRYRVTGPENSSAVVTALRSVVERHDALRAVFRHEGDEPVMLPGACTAAIQIDEHDLADLPPAERESRRAEVAADRGRTVLDLMAGPPLAATLTRLGEREWELVVAVHHMVFDGWSAAVLADDLAQVLGGGRLRVPSDYAAHRYEVRARAEDSARTAELLAHWTDRMDGVDTTVEVPADRPRSSVRSFAGAKTEQRIDPSLMARVERAARSAGTTPHTFLLAALQTLLARLTGHTDITVLAPFAHRVDETDEHGVGAYISVLPLRTDLSGSADFATVLRRANEAVLDALGHQDQPLDTLVRALGVRAHADRGPLTQVMLIVVNTPVATYECGPVRVEHLGDTHPGTTKLDLTFTFDFPAAGPILGVEYASELFDAATARRLLEQLLTVVKAAADRPDRAVDRLPVLTSVQREQVVTAGATPDPARAQAIPNPDSLQDTEADGSGVHLLFEQHARRTPDAPAVTHLGEHWSYQRLDDEAERIARCLRRAGVGRGSRVGIHLPRGPLTQAAVLAVWKAGAAYVPLDPGYPAERLRHMFTDSGCRMLLTAPSTTFRPADGTPVVDVTRDDADSPDPNEPPPTASSASAADPAYVLYTSGTTGLPKGVVVSHANLRHAVAMWQEAYALEAGWSHLQAANSSFDVFVGETVRALATGGRLVVCPHETLLDPPVLLALLRDEEVHVAELVPTVLRGLIAHTEQVRRQSADTTPVLPAVRILAGGAEKWYVHEYRRALSLVGPTGRVVNSYGVTEATVDNAYFEGDVDALPASAPLPIGRPYPGNRLYVLDAYGEPVPFGVTGELWIGGPGVAVGYHERDELTTERFRPDPFSPVPEARMYRTGDGARLRADGVMEFVGRLDDQVKLNGHRIELDEVEAALAAQPGVRSAAVALRTDPRGVTRLIGYAVASDPDQPLTPGDLRRGMQDVLPHYAVPAQTLLLRVLPVSANGKTDRRALPDPPPATDAQESPRAGSTTEKELAALWADVLGHRDVGIEDGFFELGGDSFAALRLVRLTEQRFGVRVALVELYRHATVRRLAAHLDRLTGAEPDPAHGTEESAETRDDRPGALLQRFTPPRPGGGRGTLVCIPYSGGHALSFEPLARALPDDWSVYALQVPGRDWSRPDEEAPGFDELVDRCLEEMRDLSGPLYLYGHCHGSALTVELGLRAEAAGLPLAGVAIGAMFPMARLPGRLFDWLYRTLPVDRLVSDRAILEEIRALGGGMADFTDPAEYAFAMRSVRHDERGSEDYYARTYGREDSPVLRAPLLSVVGSKDRVTELYTERHHEWEHYADSVDLAVIPKAGHGFLKHQAPELAGELTAWADRTSAPDTMSGPPTPDTALPASTLVPDAPPLPAAPTAPAPAVPPPPSGRRSGRDTPRDELRRFAAVAAGQFVSTVGSALSQLVMSLWVFDKTGSVTSFAFVAAISLLPGLLLGPVAGVVADRYDRRTVMLLSDTTGALATLGMIALISADRLSMPSVYLLCAVTSVTTAFQRPAYLAAVSQLVPKPFLGNANGIAQLGTGAGALFAPMLGAWLLALAPLSTILLIDIGTFLVAVTTLLLVRFPDRLFKRREESVRSEIVHGWRYIAKRPGLLAMLRYFVVDHFLYAAGFALITPLVLIEYGTATLGVVLSAGGLGALLGALTMSIWGGTGRRTQGMLLFMGANNLGLLVVGVGGHPWVLVVGMFTMAFTESLIDGHWVALLQRKVGLELQGRVLALFITLVTLALPITQLVIGPLSDHVFQPALMPGGALAGTVGAVLGTGPGRGLALVIVVSGVLLTLWTLRAWFNRPLRLVEDHLPDAIPDPEIEDRDTEQRRADERLRSPAGQRPGGTLADPTECEWLETWRGVYDASYTGSWDAMGEDFSGWDSSYDGTPIPVREMREWRDAVVDRLLALRPRRVLEIGVGSGALLTRVAPHCERYVGTDLSPVAVTTLGRHVAAHPQLRERTELIAQPAHETGPLTPGSFDTVVLNSVVQYFPSEAYLTRVLTTALSLLAPGGRLFVGDVRNLRLQRCLAAGTQAHRSPDADPATLRALIDAATAAENELLVAPEYFTTFAARQGTVAAVDSRTKPGTAPNELTRYRYDVVLTTSPAHPVELGRVPDLRWGTDVTGIDALRTALTSPDRLLPVRVAGVPNTRIRADLTIARQADGLPAPALSGAPDPHEFHLLGRDLGLDVLITWSSPDATRLDVIFAPATGHDCYDGAFTPSPAPTAESPLTNTPSARES